MSLRLLKQGLYYVVGLGLLLEVLLRIVGYLPYEHTQFSVRSSPPQAYKADPKIGIQLNSGSYDITINDELTFHTTHEAHGYRKVSESSHSSPPEVLMLGCSYTYGYGVNDDEHFTAILQSHYPEIHFRNAGVIGHGTVQALIQLKKALTQFRPKLVIVNFSSYHFIRNTLSQQYRSHLKIGYSRSSNEVQQQMAFASFPYLTSCNDSIQIAAWDQIYDNWPGRESLALINAMQTTYDNLLDDEEQQIRVTACLLHEMARLCTEKGVDFQIACLNSSPASDELKIQLPELSWFEVGFNFSDTTLTNHPYDEHPSPEGHQFIADKMNLHLGSTFQQIVSIQNDQINLN